mmetsp:Transcript_1483/g.3089  ORF Transcript_1483/g.3089 Transcript_1483/m.3089 type:complete len:207 (+) Transcript_1483:167-787(+)
MAARRRCGASGGTASRRMARLCSGSQEDVDESGLERTRESSVWSRLCFSLSISKTAHRHDGRNECIGSRPATKLHEDLCVSPVVSSEWALSNKTKNRLAHAYEGNISVQEFLEELSAETRDRLRDLGMTSAEQFNLSDNEIDELFEQAQIPLRETGLVRFFVEEQRAKEISASSVSHGVVSLQSVKAIVNIGIAPGRFFVYSVGRC